jgi:ubiquinone/menaquinone biosynthesis C-methylase UbiE
MHPSFETWDIASESLESVENRIHDGAPREALKDRAWGYIDTFARFFPWSFPEPGGRILEVGSGLGYVMQAAAERLAPASVVGLDVAPTMIAKGKQRFVRDGVADARLEFSLYDGVTIPYDDNSFDFVYSVASIQHIPKCYAYNLFFEINRILKPSGFAALQMLSYSLLPSHLRLFPLKEEVLKQIRNEVGHWHFFYSQQELLQVLSAGVGVGWLAIREENGSLWTTFSKDKEVAFCNDTILDSSLISSRSDV